MASRIARALGFKHMAAIRSALNRLTRGRVGLYSTAEHYSSGPAAKVLSHDQYDEDRLIECPRCGWKGPGKDGRIELFDDLFDVSCRDCGAMLLVVSYR